MILYFLQYGFVTPLTSLVVVKPNETTLASENLPIPIEIEGKRS